MDLFTTAKVSPKGKLNAEDLKQIGMNILKYTAPMLAVFFGQLAMGVEPKKAMWVAIVAFWGILANTFTKLSEGK